MTSEEKNGDFIKNKPNSMFLTAVEENEIIEVVHKCENKTSVSVFNLT